jgi:hypothetical protein
MTQRSPVMAFLTAIIDESGGPRAAPSVPIELSAALVTPMSGLADSPSSRHELPSAMRDGIGAPLDSTATLADRTNAILDPNNAPSRPPVRDGRLTWLSIEQMIGTVQDPVTIGESMSSARWRVELGHHAHGPSSAGRRRPSARRRRS